MERYERWAAVPAVKLGAVVPLTSRAEEDRYWYEPGERACCSLAGGERVYTFHRFGRDEGGVDISWSGDDLRSGH